MVSNYRVRSKTTKSEGENSTGGASGVVLPMGPTGTRSLYNKNSEPDPLTTAPYSSSNPDPDIQRMRNQGYTITNPQTWIPNADGKFVLQTVSTDELRQQKAQARKDRYYDSLYDERYEPKNKGRTAD
jgi:hypothetical protein